MPGTSKKRARKRSTQKRAAPRREGVAALRRRVVKIIEVLKIQFPEATTALTHHNPYQLLVATILSAQCTDKRVNMVTPVLFAAYPHAQALAEAHPQELEELIRSTGFFRNKARNLISCAKDLVSQHQGDVPDTMAALTALSGVGRKTANVVLGNAFEKDEGIVVDTHVNRISNLLGLTAAKDPIKVEQDLMAVVPRSDWTPFSHLLILHGRATCVARRPRCAQCVLFNYCPGRQETAT